MANDPLIGQSIGRWKITRLLGAGGMGRVYEAVQPSIGARVAVKVLTQTEDPDLVARFFAEARAVNLIRHEKIVDILDLDSLPDGRPYIVMELVDGTSLAQAIQKRGPLPLAALARVVGEVLDALGAAHSTGIVHRDLKPDNIFVTPAGHAKVLDFGIAKLAPELKPSNAATSAGVLLGTPAYMSPEQASTKVVDLRTDLWAMGVVLFEGATGQLPFAGSSLYDLLRALIEEKPPEPRSLRPSIPPAMEAVILRALEKDPAWRFQSAHEMALALAASVKGLPDRESEPIYIATAARPAGDESFPDDPAFTPTFDSNPKKNASSAALGPTVTPPGREPSNVVTPIVTGSRWTRARVALAAIALLVLGGGVATAIVMATSRSNSTPIVVTPITPTTPAPLPIPTPLPPTSQPTSEPTSQPAPRPGPCCAGDPASHSITDGTQAARAASRQERQARAGE